MTPSAAPTASPSPTAEPVHEHTPERVRAKDPTCTEAGYTGDLVCTECGETVAWGEETAALGHRWSDWTEDGYIRTRTCERCRVSESEPGAVAQAASLLTDFLNAPPAADITEDGTVDEQDVAVILRLTVGFFWF